MILRMTPLVCFFVAIAALPVRTARPTDSLHMMGQELLLRMQRYGSRSKAFTRDELHEVCGANMSDATLKQFTKRFGIDRLFA